MTTPSYEAAFIQQHGHSPEFACGSSQGPCKFVAQVRSIVIDEAFMMQDLEDNADAVSVKEEYL